MPLGEETARELLEAQPDRFEALLADAPPETALTAAANARWLATLVRSVRASYVLLIGGAAPPEGLDAVAAERLVASLAAYRALHIAAAFGHTGQVEVIERGSRVAEAITRAAERHALAERVNVHGGDPVAVTRALNGPYDLAVLTGRERDIERLAEDLARLIRTGGSLTVVDPAATAESGGEGLRRFLARIAADDRYLLSTGLDFAVVLAARVR